MEVGESQKVAQGASHNSGDNIMGREIKKWLYLFLVNTTALMLLAGFIARPALAADPALPDSFQIISVQVTHYVIEQNDFLLSFHYNIHYNNPASQPTTPANKLFHFRLIDTDGSTQLGAIAPYPYQNSGFDQGVTAFYFPASTAPDWEQAYTLRMEGNPQYWTSPPVITYTLVASDYSQLTSKAENQTLLGNYLINIARDLEINWSTKLLIESSSGTVLNSTGDAYFRGTINGLQYMAPKIFASQSTNPIYEPETWTQAQGHVYEQRYAGTWIGDALEQLGATFHVQWNVITGIFIVLLILGIFIICQMKFSTSTPGIIAGSLILLMGAVMGWVAAAIMAITTILFAMYFGYVIFFRQG